ncbi:MAG: hypothetical protein V9G08_05350 [Dermatophilaceae bacterium]
MTDQDLPKQQEFFEKCAALIRRYHGWTISGDPGDMSEPCLIVSHHGFGTMTDPGVYAVFASLGWIDRKLPVTIMMHDLNWKMKMGKQMEQIGGQPASRQAFSDAVARGHHVSVAPGGDYDTGKAWKDRNTVDFHGRSGFAKMAMAEGTPIVPIVTAGAAEGAFVVTNGAKIARTLRLNKIPGFKTLPISVSVPWGVTVGGPPPYVPLPVRMQSRVLPKMTPEPEESAADYGRRVQDTMQAAMDELVAARGPLLGYPAKRG